MITVALFLIWPFGGHSPDCSKKLTNGQYQCRGAVKPSAQARLMSACRVDGERVMFTIPAGAKTWIVGTPVKLISARQEQWGAHRGRCR